MLIDYFFKAKHLRPKQLEQLEWKFVKFYLHQNKTKKMYQISLSLNLKRRVIYVKNHLRFLSGFTDRILVSISWFKLSLPVTCTNICFLWYNFYYYMNVWNWLLNCYNPKGALSILLLSEVTRKLFPILIVKIKSFRND